MDVLGFGNKKVCQELCMPRVLHSISWQELSWLDVARDFFTSVKKHIIYFISFQNIFLNALRVSSSWSR